MGIFTASIGVEMREGDYIYYIGKNGDTSPGEIIKFSDKRIKIEINHYTGDNEIWVSHSKIELQTTTCDQCGSTTNSRYWPISYSGSEYGKAERKSCPICGYFQSIFG